MPIPSSAAAVAVVISRSRIFPSLMVSRPLSLKIPSLVACVDIATISSALSPASLKYLGYSLIVSRNSPLAFAPLTSPSCIIFKLSETEMPKALLIVLADCIVSVNSKPNVLDTARTSLRTDFISSPVNPVNCFVSRVASINPLL